MKDFRTRWMRILRRFLISILPFLLAGGCLQQVKQEEFLLSARLDPEGHPVAFRALPKAGLGYVDWVAAVKQGILQPRKSLDPNVASSPTLDLDIVFKISNAYPMPDVVFPHAPHTLWLECKNCHPQPFIMKQGANPVSMDRIIKGEFCGRCHGRVAFTFEDCFRCHSLPK